jgi:hypothetical protein
MRRILDQLVRDCVAYRRAVDQIFSSEVVSPSDWRHCLLEIQTRITWLQLDRLILIQKVEEIKNLPKGPSSQTLPSCDVKREMELRIRMENRLEAPPVWSEFKIDNPLAKILGLHSIQDYIGSFRLHLPEVYEETFRIEQMALLCIADPNRAVLNRLMVALQHVGLNHINFVQPALGWASDEDFWN